jgi:intracellular septation protein A
MIYTLYVGSRACHINLAAIYNAITIYGRNNILYYATEYIKAKPAVLSGSFHSLRLIIAKPFLKKLLQDDLRIVSSLIVRI